MHTNPPGPWWAKPPSSDSRCRSGIPSRRQTGAIADLAGIRDNESSDQTQQSDHSDPTATDHGNE
jgi:hypothetical protein